MMPTKRVTNDTVAKLLEQAGDTAELAKWVSKAVGNCKIDAIDKPCDVARLLIAYSQNIMEAAGAMLALDDMQKLQAETAAHRKELDKLRTAVVEMPAK